MTDSQHSRTEWPELVGVDIDEAVSKILSEREDLQVQPVPATYAVTADYRTDRVRVRFDEATRTVSRTPCIG
ncbi:hypothetical protein GXW82_00230 [Streptacidiphilus sp. 4-A2]|nr:hypothetical protein [Streptacidiphilus sp. 4-A2]